MRGDASRSTAEHLEDGVFHRGPRLVEVAGREELGIHQLVSEGDDGVGFLPDLDLLPGAVAGGVGRGVPADAIGDGIQQSRPAALAEDPHLSPEGVDHRERVVSVDALGVHLLEVDAGADASDELAPHGFAVGLAAHPVVVVHAVEDQGKTTAEGRVPERPVLVHAGEADALPHRTATEGRVTDVGDDDPPGAVAAFEEGRAGCDGARTADDGVVRIDAQRGEEGVH
jgi:hypothetical protein